MDASRNRKIRIKGKGLLGSKVTTLTGTSSTQIQHEVDIGKRHLPIREWQHTFTNNFSKCTAYGFLDHSLKEDCATIQSQLKGVSDGETKKIHP